MLWCKKNLLTVLFSLIILSECFGLACSGVKDFETQYEELKGASIGTVEEITSLQEIKDGTVLEISGLSVERMAESVPIVLKLETSAINKGKIYYALATKEKYYSAEEYNGLTFLNWIDASNTTILDGVKADFIAVECSEWPGKKDTIVIDPPNYPESKKITLFTALAIPKQTYFVLLCAPSDTTITVYYFDGTQQNYNIGKGIYNGGEQTMLPIGFYSKNLSDSLGTGREFIKQAIEQIKEQKACIEESNGKKYVKWNLSRMLEEALGTYVPPERKPPVTGENRAPILQSVYFQPSSPTVQDDLSCIAEASDPDNDPLTYTFTWKLNGKKFSEKSYTKPAGTNKMSTTLKASDYQKKAGQIFECSVTVSDGKIQAGPMNARITIAEENPIEQGSGELPDSDNDGVPDESDECPNEAGPASNNGCPVEAQEQQPESPLIPNRNQVLFIFMPIDWQETEQEFSREVNAQLVFLREKSGIDSMPECSNLEFVKRELPKNTARECGISVSSCIDPSDLVVKVFNCLQQKIGITLNNKRIVFAGLTDIDPAASRGEHGFMIQQSGRCTSGAAGFHLLPLTQQYANTKITIALASNVGLPKAGFQPLSHEIGHCIGFCEQYSIQDRIIQNSRFKALGFGGCTDKYPGDYQVQGNIIKPLFKASETCPNEITPLTICPELVAVSETDAISLGIYYVKTSHAGYVIVRYADLIKKTSIGECTGGRCTRTTTQPVKIAGLPNTDCLGRRFKENNKETRGMMGPGSSSQKRMSEAFPNAGYDPNPERSFDCFQKEQFKRQWCST